MSALKPFITGTSDLEPLTLPDTYIRAVALAQTAGYDYRARVR
ncbi:MAG: hypothetical protein AB7T01_01045 [Acidithiobacillus sp.]|jgi:hypothetical protein